MAISSYCSLNFLAPPTTSSSSPIPTTPQVSCPPTVNERSWRNRCLLGLTCAIIGLEGGGQFPVVGDQQRAMAMDMGSGSTAVIIRAPRWSDKRACLPWRINSLETIVPENLPRPSARRRWGATGFSETAPPVKVVVKSGAKGCFSL
ncbi:hypothetical protein C2S52_008686 [Perilla frutescens var. hirtella]|uniref:Uncharacterized protein n=1 Tax=Perilla frutescens var. hirtella TaxID=608512 RepID=A0AAD4JMU3_PERFH|nr:hypothetical protein C2S52_008686 [Perilla frutescens var. hirtella]KAH6836762.1 hypothetical protein C2S53_007828 [Perilla frutescens var. hirtella]